MGFFSGVRRRIKKLIPKEVRPFVPYLAAMIPGGQLGLGAFANANPTMYKALMAGGTRFLTDDEADLKDIGITSALAAAPSALGEYAKTGNAAALKMGDPGFLTQQAKLGAAKLSGMAADKPFTTLATQGGIDAGIKAAELNEEALDEYNRMLAQQGITDRKDRRSAIRAIYEGTGTWDMDEVDSMLDTYGYRTGGRVGYAMGDRVDTDQIIEDFQRIPSIGQGIGNLARAGVDNIDKIIEVIIKTNPILATGDKIIEILVERYGVDPEVAQRKVINRMSDSNRGFGPQGPQGTPDDGYNPNIGIDAGAEDYYGETPAMPENLGDMGGNMDDMSGNSILNRLRRGEQIMPRPDRIPPIPMPEMQPDPDRIPPMPMPTMPRDPRYFDMEREPFGDGGKAEKFEESDFYNSFKYAKEGLESLEEAEDEIKPLPIRELRLARGGITDIEVEEGYDDGYGPDVPGMFEEIETTTEEDTSDMMASDPSPMDELNSLSLMLYRKPLSDLTDDEYEDLKEFAGQTALKPGLIDEYRNYKYNAEEQGQTPMSPRDYFRMEFGAARLGVKKGGKVIKIMPEGVLYKGKAKDYPGIKQLIKDMKKKGTRPKKAEGGMMEDDFMELVERLREAGFSQQEAIEEARKRLSESKAEGGLMNLGGKEMDLRGGGFVPMGAKERADDVPARLSKNEFVMTADAVRGAGGGSVQKGADLMYDQMKRLEGQA